MFRFLLLVGLLVGLSQIGCTPKVVVRKSVGDCDQGIKYYRPKPYLLITPATTSVTVKEGSSKSSTTVEPSDSFVSIELQYLPDFSEEYSINVRPGLGKADVSLKLENGWNLTELNQKIDTQFDENVSAVADVVKAVGGVIPTAPGVAPSGNYKAESYDKKWVVEATNVPIGYYEAVVSNSGGTKKLYGWKYVGFAPFNSCPTVIQGEVCTDCTDDLNGPVYGLVFERGVMTFRQLNRLQADKETNNEKTETFYGTTSYQLTPTAELVELSIRKSLSNATAYGKKVEVIDIKRIETPFPGTLEFEVKTEPALTKTLVNLVRENASQVPGAPTKLQIDFNAKADTPAAK